jgi:tagatose-1,6-bisphosphate aldolase non-catalytic subunit AgaZ/GatZ
MFATGIEKDGAEERGEAAHAVAEDAEEDAAEQHARQLPGKEILIPGGAGDQMAEPEPS